MPMPINPVNGIGDIIIDEGYQRPVKTDSDKQALFNEYLVEELFINGMFANEHSIYKPEKDETLFSQNSSMLYGDIAKKHIARYLAEGNIDLVNLQQGEISPNK